MRLAIVATALFGAACARTVPLPASTAAILAEEGRDYRVEVVDDAASHRFDIQFISMADRTICLGHSWPDSSGRLLRGDRDVTLRVGEQIYSMRRHDEYECAAQCETGVAPHSNLAGFVAYDDFPAEAFDVDAPRSLDINLTARFCDGGEASQ